MEIPGFYFDEDKKRYFRLLPGNNNNNPLTASDVRLKKAVNAAKDKKTDVDQDRRSPRGLLFLPKAVSSREMDLMSSYSDRSLQECVLSSRLKSMRKRREVDLNLLDFRGNEMKNAKCEYLIAKPENDLLLATWKNKDGFILERICVSVSLNESCHEQQNSRQFEPRQRQLVNAFPPGNKVVDFDAAIGRDTDNEYDVVICLTNYMNPESTFSSMGIYFETRDENRASFISDHNLNFEFHEVFFSCSGVLPHTFAVGGENVIRLFTPFESSNDNAHQRHFDSHTSFKVKGIVSSLKFDSNGKTFFAGMNKGIIERFDVRAKRRIQRFALHSKSVVYMHQLRENENQLVVGCHENKLLLLDVRMPNSPLLHYSGYVNDCKKIAFSVDESVGLLCCKGEDSIVNLWSVKSGKLLHTMSPTDEHNVDDCVWFSHSWKCFDQRPKPVIFGTTGDRLNIYF